MCGVPFHAADTYIARLVEKGYKVAICEQLQDPSQAKGIVERGIIRIVTPGTVSDNAMLGEKENNYILSICAGEGGAYGVAYADVSTGAFFAEEEMCIRDSNIAECPTHRREKHETYDCNLHCRNTALRHAGGLPANAGGNHCSTKGWQRSGGKNQ